MSKNATAQALQEFIDAIEATGGVRATPKGYVPVADEDWIDLGEAYMSACEAIGREPKEEKTLCECGREEGTCTFDEDDPESEHGDN